MPDTDILENRDRPRQLAAGRRWLTRPEVCEEFPITYSALTRLPRSILPYARVGRDSIYDRADIDSLLETLKTTSLDQLLGGSPRYEKPALAHTSHTVSQKSRRGRRRKPPIRTGEADR